TPLEQTRRRRLRDILLLAARLSALVLLALAFARPYLTAAAEGPLLQVVAIDRSFSMTAPGRFERAQVQAREAIAAVGRGQRVAVIAFDDRAVVIAPAGGPGEARRAVDALRPTYGATRFAPVFERALELSDGDDTRLVIVSDLQRAGWENETPAAVPASLKVEVRDVNAAGGNLAVAGVRRDADHVSVAIRNAGASSVSGTVRLAVDGRPAATAPFAAAPASLVEIAVPFRVPARGVLSAELDDPSGFAADNRRFKLLDATGRPQVTVVGDATNQPGFYVARALQAGDGENGFEVQSRPAAALGTVSAEEWSQQSALVLVSTRNLDRRGRENVLTFVRQGGGLLIAASADVDPAAIGTMLGWRDFAAAEQAAGGAVLAATDLRHPIFRPFGALAANLGQVRFTRTWKVRPDGWDVAARLTDGSPALLERREGNGRVLLFTSDVDRRWNDFPVNAAFVPFVIEAVRHAAGSAELPQEYLVADVPQGGRPEPGVYTVGDGRKITVNVDPRESATAALTPAEFTAMVAPVAGPDRPPVERQARQAEGAQNLWRYGLLLMLAALAGESLVGRVS
ncbi:MAG TPA: VWA domain-containing protein, partial [Vicinamibacterales bacterium]|nr:VWA domain-containing protein [Vicinamibacterales bacterium]